MTTNKPVTPKVFISYSHDSPEHADCVLNLANRLLGDGVDCILDQFEFSPPEGWPRWMDKHIRESDFVLMICTETYCQRVMGTEKPGTGLGVRWEGSLVFQHIYNAGTLNTRFIPVLLQESDVTYVPTPVQGATYYCAYTEDGYEDLYRRITNQPRTIKRKLGKLRQLSPRERKQDFFALPWNVPHERNPYFTGRENIIKDLVNALSKDSAGALTQAISGLGGIGKTQVAVEYAYRYHDKYSAVFWVRADTTLNLSSGFLGIAKMLNLPEKDARDSNEAVSAVKRWLEDNSGWLLVFDNADNPGLVKEFRPLNPKGHILLTSRAQVFQQLGISKPIEINEMSPEEALEFLYTRTGRKESDATEKAAAAKLAQELGYLPLALEQATAYITGKQVRFQDYLASYLKRRLELLAESGPVAGDYPESVTTTWAMNFREVEKESAAAADLLRVSAFLTPDSIPLELIKEGASQLGLSLSAAVSEAGDDRLVINTILEPLTRYSLIHHDIDAHTYSIHRLVQEVLKHGMGLATRKLWAERAIRAVSQAFPSVEFANWTLCERLLPHGMAAMTLIENYGFKFEEAGRIFNQVGGYLNERGRYAEAEPLLKQALVICEKALGLDHPDMAQSLHNLALLYYYQGKYAEVEPLLKQVLAIDEKVLRPDHPNMASDLNNLAELYRVQGKYAEAEPLLKQALVICEEALGPDHPDMATSLHNLALLYHDQGKYVEAEPVCKRALALDEKALGPDHPNVAKSLGNLAELYRIQGRYAEAESLCKRALAIREKALGPDHPDMAVSLNNLALNYYGQGKYAEAELLLKQALAIREKTLGTNHPDTATSLNNLAEVYRVQDKHTEAGPLLERALAIREKTLGTNHPDTAASHNLLAELYRVQGKYAEAEPLYKRSLAIREKALGLGYPDVARVLNNLALNYYGQSKYAEAGPLLERALAIREKTLGTNHPDTATSLNNLAELYRVQGKYAEAETLYKRSLSIREKALGPGHPDVVQSLENYAGLLRKINRIAEAKKMEARAKRIRAKQTRKA